MVMKNGLLNHLSLVLFLALLVISGCTSSGPSDPRGTVIAMFGAMEKNDRAALAHLLDLGALMSNVNEDYALQTDSPRVITNPQQILDDLTDDGLTKRRWFAMQRIVNKAEVTGETATVQVTFVDKGSSTGYMTRFGLHVANGKWKIYSFKTFQESR